ncbi:MAG TPA: hypothetical protein PKE63_12490, partial [Lacibacter sp.]|nr:hypothetical protein [Lacibacter sp.]
MRKKFQPISSAATALAVPNERVLHTLTPDEIEEKEWLLNLLEDNRQRDLVYNDSLLQEIRHFSHFVGSMLLAFPAGLFMRRQVRRNKRLSFILQFPELLSVRNNIEKGSFAYDTLLFGQSAFRVLENKSHLANLVCLAILFGDEFIDGLAVTSGKHAIRAILQDEQVDCNLHHRTTETRTELYYAFDIRDLLPAATLDTTNEKYGITYRQFYDHLLFLLEEMNRHLNRLDTAIRETAAGLICQVCNRCFDTYKTDIAAFRPDYHLRDLLHYLDKKDDDIIHCLLELRAVLLGKNRSPYREKFSGWSTMVRSMQIYDDLEDVATDCLYQMNFACYFAHRFFRKEWDWLQRHAAGLQHVPALQRHLLVSLYMPASVIACRQYARHIVLGRLNWVQKKITGYLWAKNWLGWKNEQLQTGEDVFAAVPGAPYTLKQKITLLEETVLQIKDGLVHEDFLYAHLLDTALLDAPLREHLFAFLPQREKYFLTQQFFDYPLNRKAMLARKWLL